MLLRTFDNSSFFLPHVLLCRLIYQFRDRLCVVVQVQRATAIGARVVEQGTVREYVQKPVLGALTFA